MDKTLHASLAAVTGEEQMLLNGSELEREMYTTSSRFVVDSDKLLEKGKLISVRPHTRFVAFPPHSHNYVELIYMVSGTTTHVVNEGSPLVLHTGELLFLNQHATHSIQKAEENDIAVNFIVLPTFFDTAFSMIGPDNILGKFLVSCLQKDSSEISHLHFAVADILPVQNLVENMIWGIVNEQPNNRRINQINMGLLFLQLLNHTQRIAMPGLKHNASSLVIEALREIEENYKQANLSRLAHQHNVSLAYVSRLVKQATGQSFKQLLLQKRLEKAAQLLRETRLTTQDIIEVVGYENTSYFYRAFKQAYGTSPSAYRNTNTKGDSQ